MVGELGLADDYRWVETKTGFYAEGQLSSGDVQFALCSRASLPVEQLDFDPRQGPARKKQKPVHGLMS